MKITVRIFLLIAPFLLVQTQAHEGCTCGAKLVAATTKTVTSAQAAGTETKDAPKRHPLRGVIVNVLPEQSALLVKHEEIPGVMKAMTMLLKVNADTLKSPAATKGTAITGFLLRKTDGWWLEDVRRADSADNPKL
ncbi:MAG: hypothetical protein ABW223_06630 [Rariglobus sp.]